MRNGSSGPSEILVSAVQASAPPFDRAGGIAKATALIAEAAKIGSRLVVFPEAFIPGFPVWAGVCRPIDGHSLFRRFAASSIRPDKGDLGQIQSAAARGKITVSLGFSEVSPVSNGALWNSQVLIGENGDVLNLHRKLVPTFYEQLVWTRGDGAGLRVVQTPIGRVGGLICGENNNPLARYSLMAQGEEIHCACYPAVWPFRDPLRSAPYDLRDAIRFRAASHSFEAKVFTIVSAAIYDEPTAIAMSDGNPQARAVLDASPRACSMIVAPSGEVLSPQLDGEGLVSAEIDLHSLLELKRHHDMAGYYHRPDVFNFTTNAERLHPWDPPTAVLNNEQSNGRALDAAAG